VDWNFSGTWAIDGETNDGYPFFGTPPQPAVSRHHTTGSYLPGRGPFTFVPAPGPGPSASPSPSPSIAPTPPYLFTLFLSRGSHGEEVRQLQLKLKALGFFPADITPTGFFGPITEAAVKAFQSAHGISPLGFVGPLTRAALNK
jgi:hypothetical protein